MACNNVVLPVLLGPASTTWPARSNVTSSNRLKFFSVTLRIIGIGRVVRLSRPLGQYQGPHHHQLIAAVVDHLDGDLPVAGCHEGLDRKSVV